MRRGKRFDADGLVFGYRSSEQTFNGEPLFRREILYVVQHILPFHFIIAALCGRLTVFGNLFILDADR